MRTALICLLVSGCAKKPVQQDAAKPIDSQVVIAPDAPALKPVVPDDCKAEHAAIMSNVRRAFQAKNTFAPRKEAVAAWPNIPASCRTGVWYLEAALLFAAGEAELTASNVKIAGEESALTLALREPDHVDVLERVALVQALGRKPTLPADACKRAQAVAADDADGAAYVCARAALAAGDGKTAKEHLAAIKVSKPFADFELAQAQAAKLLKDTKTMKAQAKLAQKLDYSRAGYAMIKEADRKAIIGLAKSLK